MYVGNQAAPTRKSSRANSEIKQCLMRHSDWLRLALLDFRVTYIYKSDWSLCYQAVQNSEINILPRVSPLTVKTHFEKIKNIYSNFHDCWIRVG